MIGTAEPQHIQLREGQRFFCTWPWQTVVLMSDGTVVCGCADPFKKRPAGNAAVQSIGEIWNGRVFQELRRGFHTNNPHLCTHCNLIQVVDANGPTPPPETVMPHLPTRLFVEPCISCNLSCYEACCNHENGIHFTRHNRLLDYNVYTRVIDELGATLHRIDFFNYGESFIHPKAIEMIAYAKSRHPHVYLFCSTNGLLLNTEEKLHNLVRSGIDEITFSIDGARQETYQIYRRGGDFGKVLRIMRRLVEIKKEQDSETPFINWRYILFRWNDTDDEMNLARKLAADIDIDKLCWEITDHPENSASERFVPGGPEYESIRHEIWSALGNAMPQKTLHATICPKIQLCNTKAKQTFACMVEVTNSGGALWKNASQKNRRHITLGVQLLDENKGLLNREYARVLLPRALKGGERETIEFQGVAPEKKGTYHLKFDMVCEGIEWFESCGSSPAFVTLRVH